MGKITEIIPDEEIERLAQQSGIYEKLPADFVPFEPGTRQRQHQKQETRKKPKKDQHAWAQAAGDEDEDVEEEDDEDEDELIDDSDEHDATTDEDDYGYDDEDDAQTGSGMNAQKLYEHTRQDALNPRLERILDMIIWTMPFTFLYLLLDIMIRQQYAQHPTFLVELVNVLSTAPCERGSAAAPISCQEAMWASADPPPFNVPTSPSPRRAHLVQCVSSAPTPEWRETQHTNGLTRTLSSQQQCREQAATRAACKPRSSSSAC